MFGKKIERERERIIRYNTKNLLLKTKRGLRFSGAALFSFKEKRPSKRIFTFPEGFVLSEGLFSQNRKRAALKRKEASSVR
jgi:hypothetical protein